MIADMIPLLLFTALVVIARNLFEAYVLDHERYRLRPARAHENLKLQETHAHAHATPPRRHFTR